jgi:hypothetical protein
LAKIPLARKWLVDRFEAASKAIRAAKTDEAKRAALAQAEKIEAELVKTGILPPAKAPAAKKGKK